jgi:hypothetical protein
LPELRAEISHRIPTFCWPPLSRHTSIDDLKGIYVNGSKKFAGN